MKRPAVVISERLAVLLAQSLKRELKTAGRTKRAAVRLALVSAIRDGSLSKAQRLPGETDLAVMFGVSLGTVQAALMQLQQSGLILRRRGQGSRVVGFEPAADDIWHFRFTRRSDNAFAYLSLASSIAIDQIVPSGLEREFLAPQLADQPCARFTRIFAAKSWPLIAAEMILPHGLSPGLADLTEDDLASVNIRPLLRQRFGIQVVAADHSIEVVRPLKSVRDRFGLTPRESYFEIHARAYGPDRSPVYFQRIYAPCAFYRVNVANTFS